VLFVLKIEGVLEKKIQPKCADRGISDYNDLMNYLFIYLF